MVAELGADLANMSDVRLYLSAVVPGEEHEGQPVSRRVIGERSLPRSIPVNRYGQRVVNEGAKYNDVSEAFLYFDSNAYDFRDVPCWSMMDSQFRAKHPVLTVMPFDPNSEWLTKDNTLAELARKVGVDAQGLQATIARLNGFARRGENDFGRGESAHARWLGDPRLAPSHLGAIEKSPFYLLPIHLAAAGTKGGPMTNTRRKVLDVRAEVIPGLCAARNAMAGGSGAGYYGGGGTTALGMTLGYICGIIGAKAPKGASA